MMCILLWLDMRPLPQADPVTGYSFKSATVCVPHCQFLDRAQVSGQTTYAVTIAATGDLVFGDGDNRWTMRMTLVGQPSDSIRLLPARPPSV